jgi:LmbE family N-acetylglucosaminyl deacetylase
VPFVGSGVRSAGRRSSFVTAALLLSLSVAAVLALMGSRYTPRTGVGAVSGGPDLMVSASTLTGSGPLVVYSPHPDDETFGMAFQILRAKAEGRRVYGVLLTDGEDSSAFLQFYRARPDLWADSNGDGITGDVWDYALQRREEYIRAMGALGVPATDLRFLGRASDPRHEGLSDALLTESAVLREASLLAREIPGATHITSMGDMPADRTLRDARGHSDHIAAARALWRLWKDTQTPVAFFKIYVFSLPWASRYAPVIAYDPMLAQQKGAAMTEFMRGNGSRRGLGADSSRTFFGAILLDPREFMVRPEDF